jgi:hypothetical protein
MAGTGVIAQLALFGTLPADAQFIRLAGSAFPHIALTSIVQSVVRKPVAVIVFARGAIPVLRLDAALSPSTPIAQTILYSVRANPHCSFTGTNIFRGADRGSSLTPGL